LASEIQEQERIIGKLRGLKLKTHKVNIVEKTTLRYVFRAKGSSTVLKVVGSDKYKRISK
jgi:citrate lyase gamma subunit